MKSLRSSGFLIIFAVIGFGPLIFAYGVLIYGLILNVVISVFEASYANSLQFIFYSAALLILLIVSILICFYGFKKLNRWLAKGAILYVFWLILAAAPVFFLTASLAGISMAVVDGSITGINLLMVILRESFSLLLLTQIGIIPWVSGATWVMKRFVPGSFQYTGG